MTQPNAYLVDAYGSPSKNGVYIGPDGSVTFLTLNSQGQQVSSSGGNPFAAIAIPRSTAQLAGTPPTSDVALGAIAQFYDPLQTVDGTHPWVYYTASTTAYVAIDSGGGSSTFAGLSDATTANIPAINTPTALAIANRFGLPLNWNASTNTPTLASGTAPPTNNSYVVTVAGTTTLDGISAWNVGDIAYFGVSSTWQRAAAAPQTGNALVASDGSGGLIPAPVNTALPGYLIQVAVPIGIAPTGSVGTNGNLTLGTSFPVTYSGGIWLYFPAGAVLAGSLAGFYWCVMSGVGGGQIYTNYIAASTSGVGATGIWSVPTSPVAVSGAGPGAYTGSTSNVFIPGVQPAGNFLGKNGSMTVKQITRTLSSAGAKTSNIYYGTGASLALINSVSVTTSSQTAQVSTMYNRGVTNSQIIPNGQDTSVFALVTATVDTTVSNYIQPRLNIAVATDFIVLESLQVTYIPSA